MARAGVPEVERCEEGGVCSSGRQHGAVWGSCRGGTFGEQRGGPEPGWTRANRAGHLGSNGVMILVRFGVFW